MHPALARALSPSPPSNCRVLVAAPMRPTYLNAMAEPAFGDDIFGLDADSDSARVVVIPVPWEATTSYRRGTAQGPAAIHQASFQVDLFDRFFGQPHEVGITMRAVDDELAAWSDRASEHAERVIAADRDGATAPSESLKIANELGLKRNAWLQAETKQLLDDGRIPCVVGGDHSVALGAIAGATESRGRIGVLHIDAHADLRADYQGFVDSHAAVMHRAVTELDEIELVSVGIRDLCKEEFYAAESHPRIHTYYDADMKRTLAEGKTWMSVCDSIVARLPDLVHVSFDIDGLDPSLCPQTGTPVPGGLSFSQADLVLERLVRARKTIVSFDLCEVSPGPEWRAGSPDTWDAIVGARMLFRLIGWTLKSQSRG